MRREQSLKNHITTQEIKEMLLYVAREIVDNERNLTKIDLVIGDGDHGKNMAAGFREVALDIAKEDFACCEDVFLAVGNILIDTTGGASGVLFGTMFISGSVKHGSSLTMDLQDFAEIFRVSLDAIKSRGRAKLGDKTMVDALEPAVLMLEESVKKNKGFCEGLKDAAKAAKQGMETTKNLPARHGRAKFFCENGVGHQDAGATSVWIVFQSMADWVEEHFTQWEQYESRILTVTMNPCIDKTINVTKISRGQTHRLDQVQNDVSGKGINVSIALNHFDELTLCLGFNYAADARVVEKALDDQGIRHDFVMVDGAVRTNVKIFEKDFGVMTEFNEKGGCVSQEEQRILVERIDGYLSRASMIVLSGSVPQGVSKDIYERIVERANLHGVKTILDTSGELLLNGLKASPFLIKPNIAEFCELFGLQEEDREAILYHAKELIQERGVSYVCISLGDHGAYMISADKVLYAPAVQVPVRGIQGAGDSMVAGFCYAVHHGCNMEEMFAYAMAAAAGSLQYSGTKLCTMADLRNLVGKVEIQTL